MTKVVNQIQVLPLSDMDNGIRRAEFRAIYSDPSLNRYALQAVPPIHIIVETERSHAGGGGRIRKPTKTWPASVPTESGEFFQ